MESLICHKAFINKIHCNDTCEHTFKCRIDVHVVGASNSTYKFDHLANDGALLNKPPNTSKIHTTHTTPYWLNGVLTGTHMGAIRNLQTYINKEHRNQESRLARSKFTYIDKWTSNDQINHKFSNQFWKNPGTIDAQITQTLKVQYAQNMGNHRKHIFWPNLYPNPNCTLCSNNIIDTWPHLLSTCSNSHMKGLRIAHHNKAVHQSVHRLQSNKHTRYYTLVIVGHQNVIPQDNKIPQWLLQCTCPTTLCTCLAKQRPYVLCILRAPIDNQPPLRPTPSHTI